MGWSRGWLTFVFLILVVAALSGCSYSFFEKASGYPAGTTSADFPDYDHYSAGNILAKKIPTNMAMEIIDLLKDTFLVKKPGVTKCTDVNTFKKFIKMYFTTEKGESPLLEYLCFYQYSSGDAELNWLISDDKGKLTWTLVPPYNLIDTDIRVLRSIDMYVESSLRITVDSDKVKLGLQGVTFNLSKAALKETVYGYIPQFFLSFEVNKIEIYNDGRYFVRLRLPLGIPWQVEGALTSYLQDHSLKVLGEDVQMTLEK
jgi:hypothetical protein